MLRDYFSDEEEEETTTSSSGLSEETTANWRKRGFKRKRIKRPRSSKEETTGRPGGHSAKCSFVAMPPLLFIQLWDCGTPSGSSHRSELSNFFGISLPTLSKPLHSSK